MSDEDVHEHEIIEEHDLDPEMVCKIIEKCNEPSEGITPVAREVMDILGISETEAEYLVEEWREPDWPIEYSRTFRVDDVDVYNYFERKHRGYEPIGFAREFDWVDVTWEIDKNTVGGSTFGEERYSVEMIEVNGVDMKDD